MANIFIDGDEIANQKDLNRLLGQNDYVSDSLDNHISETGIYPTNQANGAGYPNNTTAWGAFVNLHSGDKFLQLFFDNHNNFYLRSDNDSDFAKQPSNFEQIAWKSDIDTLKQEIADLKKQIGGVRQPANPLVSMLYVPSLEMEVA